MLHIIHRKHFHEYHFTTWRGCTIPLFPPPAEYFCYLAHFSERYKHAGHYLGCSAFLPSRLQAHRQGTGARLMEVIAENGIDWELARLWPCETYEEMRATERLLKARHSGVKLCPICQHKPLDARVLLYHGHYPFNLFGQGKRQPIGHTSVPMFVRRAD